MIVHAATPGSRPITLNLQPGGLTVALDQQTVLAYDRGGRLWSAYFNGCMFRRALGGEMLSKWSAGGRRKRQALWSSEAALVVDRSARLMRLLGEAYIDAPSDVSREVRGLIRRATRFNADAAELDAQAFARVYHKPVGILPPDQYMALLLQLTEGCSFNTCTFCTFYKDRPFHIKTPDELCAHIEAVREYMGDSLSLRQGVFLGDANALVVPQKQLVPLLRVLQAQAGALRLLRGVEPGLPIPVYAFLDGFSGAKKTSDEYAELSSLGLKRIYMGLESGHAGLLEWLAKPGQPEDAIEAARAIKAGGVNVCVIVLLGAGGAQYASAHARDTTQAINAMELGAGDLVYFSEFVSLPDQAYGQAAVRDNIQPLSSEEMQAQRGEIEAGLQFIGPPPRRVTYDIREFVY